MSISTLTKLSDPPYAHLEKVRSKFGAIKFYITSEQIFKCYTQIERYFQAQQEYIVYNTIV